MAFLSHTHEATAAPHSHSSWATYSGSSLAAGGFGYAGTTNGAFSGNTGSSGTVVTIAPAGGTETRPINAAVLFIVRQ